MLSRFRPNIIRLLQMSSAFHIPLSAFVASLPPLRSYSYVASFRNVQSASFPTMTVVARRRRSIRLLQHQQTRARALTSAKNTNAVRSRSPSPSPPSLAIRTANGNASATSAVKSLQSALDVVSTAEYKQWIERYLQNESECRGAKMKDIENVVRQWSSTHASSEGFDEHMSREIIYALFSSGVNEDALAACVYINDCLIAQGKFPVLRLVELERVFAEDKVHVWNIADSLASRVLSGLIDEYGTPALTAVCKWRHAPNVWQARASVVGLLRVVRKKEHWAEAKEGCKVLIQREERFAKTAVGWCLREMARKDEASMVAFVEEFAEYFSVEAVRNAAKWCEDTEKKRLVDLVKQKSCLRRRQSK